MGTGLIVLAVAAFALFSSYGFTSSFYYGHYGYHGGSYAAWARGTLRHHTIYPVNEPGFAKPDPHTYYIHHPMLAHQIVTLTFFVFGEHEWAVRLAAFISSTASLLLIAALGRRHLGPLAGGAAALVFAFVPINIWYGTHMDPGFPSIAAMLAFFWFYLAWLKDGRWRSALWALGFEALAGCFEWSPYFAFPAIFAHVFWTGWRRGGRYRLFMVLHPLVVMLPIATHFWLVRRASLLDDLFAAYRNRATTIPYRAFVDRMGEYGTTLFGRALLLAMAVWLLLALARLVSGRGRAVDMVGFTFAFALLTYTHVFENAVVTHAYRQLYGNVWAAMAVGDLVLVARSLGRRLRASRESVQDSVQDSVIVRRGIVAAMALLVLVTVTTLPTSWAGLMESRLHGGVPGWKVFNPDMRQTAFAIEVEHMTSPKDALYFYPSFTWTPPHRMDWAYYYDRDPRRGRSMRSLTLLSAQERQHAVAILFQSELVGDERRAFAELASHHHVFQVQDLTALDLRSEGAGVSAFRLSPLPVKERGAIGRWFEGPYPVPRLQPDPVLESRVNAEIKQLLLPPPAPAGAAVPAGVAWPRLWGAPPYFTRVPARSRKEVKPTASQRARSPGGKQKR